MITFFSNGFLFTVIMRKGERMETDPLFEMIDRMAPEMYETLKSVVFDDLELPLEGVFDFPLEPGEIRVVKESPSHYVTHETVQEVES